jgi:ABC-type Fe3+ transport system permease subunit
VSFSEIAAVSFFSAENFTPLPLLMSRFLSQYRFAEAEFIGLSLLVIAVFISSLQFWIGKRA